MIINISDILEYFQVDPQGRFEIIGSCGIIMAKMIGPGDVLTTKRAHMIVNKLQPFDPQYLSVVDRRSLVRQMCDSELSNWQIAELLGVSQSTISSDIKIIRGEK